MIKKIIAKLTSSWDRMPDASKEKAMAEERNQQIMAQRDSEGRRRYVSEQTVSSEEKILGPSESKPKEEGK